MTCARTVTLCLLVTAVAGICSGLVLERLPRHIPISKGRATQEPTEDDEPTYDTSVEKKKIIQEPSHLAPIMMKPTWKAIYPLTQDIRSHRKRAAPSRRLDIGTSEKERHELADILKDEDQDDDKDDKKKKSSEKKDIVKHTKTKRQSNEESSPKLPELKAIAEAVSGEQEEVTPNPDFQEWLRREYYRNMAKSFASMRKKRDGSGLEEPGHPKPHASASNKREKKSKKNVSFEEVTDNLRAIEDVLFLDALQAMKEAGDDYEDDIQKQNRITNDLSSAYDLETMRNALFRLKENLGNMEKEPMPEDIEIYRPSRKRSDQCPPLEILTSDCSSLGDIVPDGPLKRLLLHACNWHEVCYTCGEVFGLTSDNCDVGFIEQSQTICRGDVPCESTAGLLLLPLRQRRVFYKRSNPSVCLVDPCVEAFLRQA